jgi:adenosylcobinamide kinase/adenosylcobinamide-phosphate guanylyltransferase
MSLVVFTGGARSGKSSAAGRLAALRAADGASVCVVAFGRDGVDDEFSARVAAHRDARPASWTTIEQAYSECSPVPLSHAEDADLPAGLERSVRLLFDPVVEWLAQRDGDTIVVTNEVGDGVVPAFASGRLFRDMLGRANRQLVDRADASFLCVAGRLVALDALPREAGWPAD